MKDLLSKEYYCYNIHTSLMENHYKKILHYDFYSILFLKTNKNNNRINKHLVLCNGKCGKCGKAH